MIDRNRPLPLSEVLEIVERRRKQRARTGAIAGSALAVGAAGMAGLIVIGLQNGPSDVTPAAPLPALVTAAPTTPGTEPSAAALPPPFDSGYADPEYLDNLAEGWLDLPPEDQDRVLGDAAELAEAWGMELVPAAKAVVVKADRTGTEIDPADPRGGDELVGRFDSAGYTDGDAAALADAWSTDPRTAKILGALLLAAG